MKTSINTFLRFAALMAGPCLILPGPATAQTFATLHTFTGTYDGAYPSSQLVLSGDTMYGTANFGGSSSYGTVFALGTNGTGFTALYSFTGGSDGGHPLRGLALSSNRLYGTAQSGGLGYGTVFAVNTDGTGFTNLYSFTGGSDGDHPRCALVLSGSTLYGTASGGGNSGSGVVFRLSTDGTGFTNLYSFSGGSDGATPYAGLALSGNTLYGTATAGGCSNLGTVFAVNTDCTGFTNLHSFAGGSDGAAPYPSLVLSGGTLYGMAYAGGISNNGTLFKLSTNGAGFAVLHSFTGGDDGGEVNGGLLVAANSVYGTTPGGGSGRAGTAFAVNTDGTGFVTLHSFSHFNSGGANPSGALILSGNTLYGTAVGGGSSFNGTVFALSLPVSPPQLVIIPSGSSVILTWPANPVAFTLQATTNLVSPIWTTVSPDPVVVNGQNIVTNPISASHMLYRLSQ